MSFIDTHTHIYLEQFSEDREAVIKNAQKVGVEKFLLPNIDLDSIPDVEQLSDKFPGVAFPMMGLHPCSVKEDYLSQLAKMENFLFDQPQRYVAVGEIGIDLYWDKSTLDIQIDAFKKQIQWAKELGEPIVIHARDSFDEIFEVLDEVKSPELFGVFHCFTGNLDQAKKAIDLGFLLGIGGVATFKNGGLDKVLPNVPLEKLILETDAPYLAPTPHRGKRNEPKYIPLIAEKLATFVGCSIEEVAKQTTQNANKLFSLP